MALEKWDFLPESSNVDTYVIVIDSVYHGVFQFYICLLVFMSHGVILKDIELSMQ